MRPLFKKIINVRITGRLNHYECFRHSLGWCMSYSAFLARLFSEVFSYLSSASAHRVFFHLLMQVTRGSIQSVSWLNDKFLIHEIRSASLLLIWLTTARRTFYGCGKEFFSRRKTILPRQHIALHCRGSFMNTLKTNAKHELSLSKE